MNWERPETNYIDELREYPLATTRPDLAWDAMLWALNDGFPFLMYPQIKKPPSGWFEAALARQIGVWLMVTKLGVTKNKTLELAGVTKEMTSRCFPKIERRMEHVKFKEHAERILVDAIEKLESSHAFQMKKLSETK